MDAFVLTEQGIITGSFLQCPLFVGLLGIGLCRAMGTPIVPKWVSPSFWPILFGPISTFALALRKLFIANVLT